MISKTSLAIAEALAVNYKSNISAKSTEIVGVLNNLSVGSIPLTMENFRDIIPSNTATDGEYREAVGAVTTSLSERVHNAFNQIRIFGKSFETALNKGLNDVAQWGYGSPSAAKSFLIDPLTLNFINVSHNFFSSLWYPVKPIDADYDYKQIKITEVTAVEFEEWDSKKIIDWLDIDNQEIKELFTESSIDLGRCLTGMTSKYCIPFKYDNENGTVDFTEPDVSNMSEIFVQYIILNKMSAVEDPFPGLIKGSLVAYRNWVRLMLSAYTMSLIALKKVATSLADFPITIREIGPSVKEMKQLSSTDKTFPRVKAKLYVYYNSTGVDMCIEKGMSLSEVAAIYLFEKYVNLNPTKASTYPTNLDTAKMEMASVTLKIVDIYRSDRTTAFCGIVNKVVAEFIEQTPALKATQDDIRPMLVGFGNTYGPMLSAEFTNSECSISECVSNSNIISKFLEKIGAKDAAWIISELNSLNECGKTEVDQRKVLHEVVINFLTNVIMIKGFPKL